MSRSKLNEIATVVKAAERKEMVPSTKNLPRLPPTSGAKSPKLPPSNGSWIGLSATGTRQKGKQQQPDPTGGEQQPPRLLAQLRHWEQQHREPGSERARRPVDGEAVGPYRW